MHQPVEAWTLKPGPDLHSFSYYYLLVGNLVLSLESRDGIRKSGVFLCPVAPSGRDGVTLSPVNHSDSAVVSSRELGSTDEDGLSPECVTRLRDLAWAAGFTSG